ncbi:RNA polymerase sigma-70 factor, ECF subfamily [Asanoa hainanensis]|uniref:RNA polymerase sigma-70 factor, ECF subfamily n=1 Tax=Asanoa hainanensis TaxID=560556 RepID=A0A239PCY9_9ACTN|nr:SigE family RNA polymerase sigma factor [Asanoa hainanensis]SNT64862.1 RNA polymerase sigma-70 factor, ECF subfamily [Asanoa hainanensis]
MDGAREVDFDEFYRAGRRRMLGYVYVLTGDIVEAQDVVQEAFVRAWQRWATVGRYPDPESWVRVVAARIAISRWRGRRSRARAYARHGADRPVDGPTPDTVALVDALRQLPANQRTALALHYVLGMPVADIARETDVAVGTVKARLSRGRAALAQLMSDDNLAEVNRG